MYVLLTTGIYWPIASTDQIYISTAVGAKFLGATFADISDELTCPLWPRIDNKTGKGFSAGPLPSTQTFKPYHDMNQLLEPSKRNDKSINQVNDLNKN